MGDQDVQKGDPANMAQAHADMDTNFKCKDLDKSSQVSNETDAELQHSMKKGLDLANQLAMEILDATHWDEVTYGQADYDTLIMMLQKSVRTARIVVSVSD